MNRNQRNRRIGIYLRGIAAALLGVALLAAVGGFLDRNLPEVVTEESTERGLAEGTYLLYHTDELETALTDPDICTIVIPDGVHAILPAVTVQKELVVENGALLEAGCLDIREDGKVVVEGILNASNTLIRMYGQAVCLLVEETGALETNDNTILWAESANNLSFAAESAAAESGDGSADGSDNKTTFADAQSIHSFAEWEQVKDSKNPVRIEADMDFSEDVLFDRPVYVSEGVCLSTSESGRIEVQTDLFVNCGTISGNLTVFENAMLYNVGSIYAGKLSGGSMELEGGTCFNYGSMNLTANKEESGKKEDSAESDPAESSVYTEGTAQAVLMITEDGFLYNYGTVTAEEDSVVKNAGWVENNGYFVVENGASFENNVFYNRNQFECRMTSSINEQSGIYYGNGEYRINGITSVAVWKTADWDFDVDVCEITTVEELEEALDNSDVYILAVTAPLHVTEDLEITKPVFLQSELSMDEATVCRIKNAYMILRTGGALTVPELWLDNSLLVVDDGSLDLSGAVLGLENQSAVCGKAAEISLSDCDISVDRKSVVSLPTAHIQ